MSQDIQGATPITIVYIGVTPHRCGCSSETFDRDAGQNRRCVGCGKLPDYSGEPLVDNGDVEWERYEIAEGTFLPGLALAVQVNGKLTAEDRYRIVFAKVDLARCKCGKQPEAGDSIIARNGGYVRGPDGVLRCVACGQDADNEDEMRFEEIAAGMVEQPILPTEGGA